MLIRTEAFRSAQGYLANPVNFDGINDYLTRGGGLTGAADSKLLTFSFWIKRGSIGTTQRIFVANSFDFAFQFTSGNALQIVAEDLSGNQDLSISDSDLVYTDTGSWHHVMSSSDMADIAKRHLYLDGVDAAPTYTTYNNDTLDFTQADWALGATSTGTSLLTSQLADFQLWLGAYIDLSNAANRALFIKEGKPVNPTKAAATLGTPIVLFSGPTSTWHTNQGTGGGFTENGALTDGSGPVEL